MGTLLNDQEFLKSVEAEVLELKEFNNIMCGLLLGDGCLAIPHSNKWNTAKTNARLLVGRSINQKEYNEWLHEQLKPFVKFPPKCFREGKANKKYPVHHLVSSLHKYMTYLMSIWYADIKRLPQDYIKQFLNEKALAIWFMDDGYCTVSNNGGSVQLALSTNQFVLEDVEFLRDLLEERWGVKFNIFLQKTKKGEGYRLNLYNKHEAHKFQEIIRPFIIPSMQYKLKDFPYQVPARETTMINKLK